MNDMFKVPEELKKSLTEKQVTDSEVDRVFDGHREVTLDEKEEKKEEPEED